MVYKIEYSYISEEIKKIYEEHGGFATPERLLFCAFKTKEGLITGIHMRGGLYGQVSKHFSCGLFDKNLVMPENFHKFVNNKLSYCGLHATNIASLGFKGKRSIKTKKGIREREEFVEYVLKNNPLFEYRISNELKMNPILIDYQSSLTLPFR